MLTGVSLRTIAPSQERQALEEMRRAFELEVMQARNEVRPVPDKCMLQITTHSDKFVTV